MRRFPTTVPIAVAAALLCAAAPMGDTPWAMQDMQAMDRMHAGMMSVPSDADADQAFAAGMLPHHQAAIDMARTELQFGRDPAMRRLATAIVQAQTREMAEMQRFLAAHPIRKTGG